MKPLSTMIPILFTFIPLCLSAAETERFVFETNSFQYIVKGDGTVGGFIDRRTGVDLQDRSDTSFCTLLPERDASVDYADPGMHSGFDVHGSRSRSALRSSRVEKSNGKYRVFFSDGKKESHVVLLLDATVRGDALRFRIDRIDGPYFAIEFARCLLRAESKEPDPFVGTTMPATLNVTSREFPGCGRTLGGIVYGKFGHADASLVMLGTARSALRASMKTVAASIPKGTMPIHRGGGPFALDDPRSRGDYIITSVPIKKDEVAAWCAHLAKFGVTQVYFHQGGPFRHADFVFNKEAYPNGIADFAEVSKEFNRHGIITGILTYSHFVPFASRFVTPVPHKDLATLRTMTLDADLDATATTIPVRESTADISTTTGFTILNSVVLRIDDELVVFDGVKKAAPFGFTPCRRGAYGTKPAAHKKGAAVGHIAQKFGMVCAKQGSDLVREVAAETARAYNDGGFDMIYLDALDGTSATAECPEYVPCYNAFFINEILKGVKRDPVMDYCFLWYPISRVGEWDCARRGFRRYFDLHLKTLETLAEKRFLPGHLGWLALCPSTADNMSMLQCPPMFPEDAHYLGAKTVGWDYGLSYLDVSRGNTQPLAFVNGDILRKYRLFQRQCALTDRQRETLKTPGRHFILQTPGDDPKQWYFREAQYAFESITLDPIPGKKDRSATVEVAGLYEEQTPVVRIENRYTADKPGKDAVALVAFDEKTAPETCTTKRFDPPLDLRKRVALGLWVRGDGKGQTINVRLDSPVQYVSGHNDHFIDVDFVGWRYFTLIEADNGTREPLAWPKPCGSYFDEYRELVHFQYVSEVNVMVRGETRDLRFRTLSAIPAVSYDLTNPAVVCNGKRLVFEGSIPSGHYMEWSGSDAVVRDHVGRETGRMTVRGDLRLVRGVNKVTFECAPGTTLPAHARLVLRLLGPRL